MMKESLIVWGQYAAFRHFILFHAASFLIQEETQPQGHGGGLTEMKTYDGEK
jgi:hypothetical protein